MNYANIHRFGNKVAIYLNTGETIYLEPVEAEKIGGSLIEHAKDIIKCTFQNSQLKTFRLNED